MFEQKRFLPAIPLLALLAPVLACSDPFGSDDAAFIGVIQEILDQDDERLRFHADIVKRISWDSPRRNGVRLTVVSSTQILVEQLDGSLHPGDRGDLEVGTTIRVWTDEFITSEIIPGVAAERIEILEQEADQ